MKKLLLTLAAIPAGTMAVEASAQTYANSNVGIGLQNRIATLEARLNVGIQQGAISQNEANDLRRQIWSLRDMHNRYSYNGLTQSETRTLRQRARSVRNQLRNYYGRGYAWNDNGWDNYNVQMPSGYAYGNAYGTGNVRYDQYGRPIATGGYTYDQYGRAIPNNGYYSQPRYGQGGPYEPTYRAPSSGIGNVLGGVLGSVVGGGGSSGGMLGNILGNGGLSVGSVITSTIANALGGGSRYGYQDRSTVYFRSDGQRVYEIDARTNQVIRVHPLR